MTKRISVVLFGLLVTSLCAFGDVAETDWRIAGSAVGSYSWAGGSAPLVASGLVILDVTGLFTPLNDGTTKHITAGKLSFTSGDYTGDGTDWIWGGGPPATLSLTGCIAGVTSTGPGGSCTSADKLAILVSDEFTSVTITPIATAPKKPKRDLVFGGLSGSINSKVAAFYGVPTGFSADDSTGSDVISISAAPGHAFSGAHSTAPGGVLSLSAPEYWSFSSTFGVFAFALALFGLACRLGLLKVVVL